MNLPPSDSRPVPHSGDDPRMRGLAPADRERLFAAARAIRDRRADIADAKIAEVLLHAPDFPEALRLRGILRTALGRHDEAIAILSRLQATAPADPLVLTDLGNALAAANRIEDALAQWRRATELAPGQPMPWFNLGRNLQLRGDTEAALAALERATALAPHLLPAWVLQGDALAHLGRFDAADAAYRRALQLHTACGDAWRGLANIKTRPLGEADRARLQAALARPDVAETDRIAMGYALGKLLEDQGRYRDAFTALADANHRLRRAAPWDARAFHSHVDAVIAACASLAPAPDPSFGTEAIFIVGMPRTGSTLVEQILAAHPDVEGASELPDLDEVLTEESTRRGRPFPHWIAEASLADWRRLGEDYLRRTARWRNRRPRFTDKMPENWRYVGVLPAMLPGATVIDVRRDPVEVGWSCFKQPFYRLPHFSCDFGDIGAYWRDCTRALDAWRSRPGLRLHQLSYEALVAEPEREIAGLVAACGLRFDPACLEFHRAQRSVRTPSASQVRERLRADTARAAHYGALLAPLVAALLG